MATAETVEQIFEQIDQVQQQADAELAAASSPAELEQFRIRFLGANGLIKNLMKLLGQVPREHKPAVGQRVNALKDRVSAAYEQRKAQLSQAAPELTGGILEDVTEPGLRPRIGNKHIIMKVTDELTELFGRMGFSVASGPEVEDEFHNFIALNIPASHPARDPLDNFYLEGSNMLLRTQTSTVQIRVMETQKPPIRVVIPGRVYRPDTVDDTHLFMFHQLEALVVDKGVTMVDLKSTIMQFVHAYFGQNTRVRFRPSFFPFTEPSAECDVWFEDKQRWIELGGCGMVHPNVLSACKIDPEIYTGWAFGFGIERIAMRKYGINNIRLFVENDVRFLKQF
ncbi:phenylalanine--tRNA ligase subunit alpha [Fontivita pretiosa]|uniref:phenylalanine--tRNA ligase subunit alpha n=1 Tax=Fontivita pretiosa TaxID=2989684 RepID=UPI003D186E2B